MKMGGMGGADIGGEGVMSGAAEPEGFNQGFNQMGGNMGSKTACDARSGLVDVDRPRRNAAEAERGHHGKELSDMGAPQRWRHGFLRTASCLQATEDSSRGVLRRMAKRP
jgi:hypothetical protein